MVNVLFTSVGRRVELLRAFRQAYSELELEGSIVAVDIDPLAPALREADRVHILPRLTDERYIPALAEVVRRERIDLVFPLIDPDVPVLAGARSVLEAEGARVVALSEESASTAADKLLTYRLFRDLGVETAQTWLPHECLAANLQFPVFIKPRYGSAAVSTFKVDDGHQLLFFARYVPDAVVQEYLPGPEITNDVICDFDGEVMGVVSRQRIEVRSGEVAKGKTVHDPEIIKSCVEIARALDARGPITVQCIMRDETPYFTEVNARFGGGVPLSIAAGVPSPKWMLALAAGIGFDVPPLGDYRRDFYMTRFDTSLFVSEEENAALQGDRF